MRMVAVLQYAKQRQYHCEHDCLFNPDQHHYQNANQYAHEHTDGYAEQYAYEHPDQYADQYLHSLGHAH